MRILIIQTAFLGDVILVTPLMRELKHEYPNARIDVLVRKGNESLLKNNAHINAVLIWDKKRKYASLLENLKHIRQQKYDEVICVQRYFNAGFLAVFSKAKSKSGFRQNPWSFFFNRKVNHVLNGGKHEVERNFSLIEHLVEKPENLRPEIFPSKSDFDLVEQFQHEAYFCLAPASVWFTKQLPEEKWVELIHLIPETKNIYLIGGPDDFSLAENIRVKIRHQKVLNLCGKLSVLQSAALMKSAERNFVNDSGPLHIASAMNANVTAFFCSTIPDFGFGPLSQNSQVLEVGEKLSCRPCGTHGYKSCPKGHFKCGKEIDLGQNIWA